MHALKWRERRGGVKKKEKKGGQRRGVRENGVNGEEGKGRAHSWRCSTLFGQEKKKKKGGEEEQNASARHGGGREACSSRGWHSVWRGRGGSSPRFQLALSILSLSLPLICLPPCHPAHPHPPLILPPLPPCLSLPGFKDACGWLALRLPPVVGWLVGGGSPGDGLRVLTPRRCRLFSRV